MHKRELLLALCAASTFYIAAAGLRSSAVAHMPAALEQPAEVPARAAITITDIATLCTGAADQINFRVVPKITADRSEKTQQPLRLSEASHSITKLWGVREGSPLEGYKLHVWAFVAIALGQATVIGWLLHEHRRWRRSDAAAHELSGRLIAAQEEERSRLARELHDDVTQRLALLAILAGREERRMTEMTPTMRAIREELVRLSDEVHALSYRLHPSMLTDLGLAEALKAECERFSRSTSVPVELSLEEAAKEPPPDVGLCLFRIVEECLANIARHAPASRAAIQLRPLKGGLQLVARDNGIGLKQAQCRVGASLGHASMKERVALLGGKLTIESNGRKGTTIAVWVPLP